MLNKINVHVPCDSILGVSLLICTQMIDLHECAYCHKIKKILLLFLNKLISIEAENTVLVINLLLATSMLLRLIFAPLVSKHINKASQTKIVTGTVTKPK